MPVFSQSNAKVFDQRNVLPNNRLLQQQLASGLIGRGSSTAPVQSPLEGIARAGTGLVGALLARQGIGAGKKRDAKRSADIARALAAGPEERAGILAGNPDTAEIALQLQLGQEKEARARSDYLFQQENKAVTPAAPKTVDVGGNVHILNPDGSLGNRLGPEEQYIPVPGVGVFEPGTGSYIGQTVQAGGGQLPAPPGEPAAALPPAIRGKAQASELQSSLAEIAKDRAALVATNKIDQAAGRFGELLNVQETGGVLRNIPGAATVEGAFDPEVKEMAALMDRITPLMRQGLPGAASDRDVAMFRGAAFGTAKDRQTNRNIILGFQTSAQIARDRVEFKDAYVSQNGSLRGAEAAWRKYLEANPIFDPDSDARNPRLNDTRQNWQDYFTSGPGPTTGFTVRKVK